MTATDVTTDTDRAEFEARYREHRNTVYSRMLARTSDPHRAEDLTAAAFERAWERRDQFHGGSYESWVWTIARNKLLDEVKSSAFTKTTVADLTATGPFADQAGGSADPGDVASDRDLVRRLSGALTSEHRELLTARYLLDGSVRDVADAVGTSERHGAARTRAAVTAAQATLGVTLEPETEARTARGAPSSEGLWSIDRIAAEYGWQGSGARSFVARSGVDQVATSVSRGHGRLYDPQQVRAAYRAREDSQTNVNEREDKMATDQELQAAVPASVDSGGWFEVTDEWLAQQQTAGSLTVDQALEDADRSDQLNRWHADDQAAETAVGAETDVA